VRSYGSTALAPDPLPRRIILALRERGPLCAREIRAVLGARSNWDVPHLTPALLTLEAALMVERRVPRPGEPRPGKLRPGEYVYTLTDTGRRFAATLEG
jgi:hypothetical protein